MSEDDQKGFFPTENALILAGSISGVIASFILCVFLGFTIFRPAHVSITGIWTGVYIVAVLIYLVYIWSTFNFLDELYTRRGTEKQPTDRPNGTVLFGYAFLGPYILAIMLMFNRKETQ